MRIHPDVWEDATINDDLRHLELLSVFHYVVAAIAGLFGLMPFIHLAVGIAMLSGAFSRGNGPPPVIGLLFVIMATVAITCAWALAVAMLFVAKRLKSHERYTFCLVVAAIECTFMPFGTVLGVFTLIVLMRPPVKQLFEAKAAESW